VRIRASRRIWVRQAPEYQDNWLKSPLYGSPLAAASVYGCGALVRWSSYSSTQLQFGIFLVRQLNKPLKKLEACRPGDRKGQSVRPC